MAADLTVPSYKVHMRAVLLCQSNGWGELPPMDELARLAGEPVVSMTKELMLRKAAVKMLGGLVVDHYRPQLAEHIQAMRGVKDAELQDDYAFDSLKEARKYQRDLIRLHGTEQLELALA